MYFYRPPEAESEPGGGGHSVAVELELVNLIRQRLTSWRKQDYPGVSRTTLELLRYWQRDGRQHPLFFAQIEAAETIILLTEARQDFLHGIEIPRDEPGDEGKQKGYTAFLRYACKMATVSGKTTVMAMLAAWSILNKVSARSDGRFSDTVLVACPNVTIRNRLQELLPERGEASLYRTRDIVPAHLMPELLRGTVVVTNWHVFEPQSVLAGGVSARVVKAGIPVRRQESVFIGEKAATSRGRRYLTRARLERLISRGFLEVKRGETDARGELKKIVVDATRYVESDASVVNRVLGRQVGGKKNILVFNDEAHHAYRIRKAGPEEGEESLFGEEEADEEFFQEATVWVEGLDRIHKSRGINFCVDLSATPYYLGRVGPAVRQRLCKVCLNATG